MAEDVLNKIRGKLIVSCQAREGWPMYGTDIMAAFARAAEMGGAAGIRATGPENIRAIKQKVNLPIIGINKIFGKYPVYITPTYASAEAILREGIDIVALDATPRERDGHENPVEIALKIHEYYPNVLVMGEISTVQEAVEASEGPYDLISTTLCGYTDESKEENLSGIELLKQISPLVKKPIIAEGKISTAEMAVDALKAGAYAIVVGTAITRPEVITSRFVSEMNSYEASLRR
ncbi:MAG: N-acetylmannosamine-6-phosphate 2-epimerase [Galactobacillus timonensis]|uniref:N-acetylmannosamine-6-phosphate 2-epimerase n=1 Tax=Galactobacillus timonensis TaxID=2041840 RepID=UPI0024098BE1|nr:N-acetylmannosamine-6-phosphate 2-epimerase [Galactobacillus timonensis]MDD6599276.1 N-acetylmannosamine-6-phosphate 2-epimerase [Galactobacillus timonensis]